MTDSGYAQRTSFVHHRAGPLHHQNAIFCVSSRQVGGEVYSSTEARGSCTSARRQFSRIRHQSSGIREMNRLRTARVTIDAAIQADKVALGVASLSRVIVQL